MNAISIGPLIFSNERLHAVIALAVFLLVLELVARRWPARAAAAHRWSLIVAASWIIAARAGFVFANREVFAAEPFSALALWQGGFAPAAGFAGLSIVALAALWRRPEVLRPLLIAVVTASGALAAAGWVLPVEAEGELPGITLPDLIGNPVTLADAAGRPVVLNLWASWCPPCRREMPMMMALAEAQEDVVLRFANQGEPPATVQGHLDGQHLDDDRVILDRDRRLMEEFDLLGLPSTLFFDADGALVSVHTGEISRAELINRMNDLQETR